MNKKENKKMGNLKCIAVILALTAMVAGGAARMRAVAGDYILDDICGTYYGFVNCRPATLILQENQRFSMSIQGTETETRKLAGKYSIVDETLNLQDEESGREFVLVFDCENASMDAGEASIRFSADPSRAAARMFPVA